MLNFQMADDARDLGGNAEAPHPQKNMLSDCLSVSFQSQYATSQQPSLSASQFPPIALLA
jgi:hypothetical protein